MTRTSLPHGPGDDFPKCMYTPNSGHTMEAGGEGGWDTWNSLAWSHGPGDPLKLNWGPPGSRPAPSRPEMFPSIPPAFATIATPCMSPCSQWHIHKDVALHWEIRNIRCLPFYGPSNFEKFASSLVTFPVPRVLPAVLTFRRWRSGTWFPGDRCTGVRKLSPSWTISRERNEGPERGTSLPAISHREGGSGLGTGCRFLLSLSGWTAGLAA